MTASAPASPAPVSGRSLPYRLTAIGLGLIFALYGLVKLFGGQFHHGPFVLDRETAGGPQMVWCFFGYSEFYGRFLGVAEMLPALLLLIPRTRTVGAALLFPVVANITIMDYAFDFPPVKHAALLYTVACAGLLFADRAKFRPLLWSRERCVEAARGTSEPPAAVRGPRRRGGRLAPALGVPAAGFLLNLLLVALDPGPQDVARLVAEQDGHAREDLELRRTWMEGQSGFDRRGRVDFVLRDEPGRHLVLELRKRTGFHEWEVTDRQTLDREPKGLPGDP